MQEQNRHGQRSWRPPRRMMPVSPGSSPVAGKPAHISFDAGRLDLRRRVLVLAEIERRLGIAERLARRLEDLRTPRGPARARRDDPLPRLVDRGRRRGCQRLRCPRADPAFKMAVGRLLSAAPTRAPSRPCAGSRTARTDRAEADDGGDGRAVLRQLRRRAAADRARHRRYRRSGPRRRAAGAVPRPLRQPLLLLIDVDEASSGKPVAVILRPAGRRRCRSCPGAAPRRQGHRARWPRVEILVRGDSHTVGTRP